MSFENIVGKEENVGNQYFASFPTMFSTLPKAKFSVCVTLFYLSANTFNLVKSKILLFGKELTHKMLNKPTRHFQL